MHSLLGLDAKAAGADRLFAAISAATAHENLGNPGVAPPQSHPHGASYAEWSARWWEYVYSIPAKTNPLLDDTGQNFSVGQSGSVWYLVGVGSSSSVTRNVTLPAGKALFFPVVTVSADNLNEDPGSPGFGTENLGFSVMQLRAQAKGIVDEFIDNGELAAIVDGKPINNLNLYRVTSPVFSYTLPPDNIKHVPPVTVHSAVADGVYLMLDPLSVGSHTVHFIADAPAFEFHLDVTYNITVTPGKA